MAKNQHQSIQNAIERGREAYRQAMLREVERPEPTILRSDIPPVRWLRRHGDRLYSAATTAAATAVVIGPVLAAATGLLLIFVAPLPWMSDSTQFFFGLLCLLNGAVWMLFLGVPLVLARTGGASDIPLFLIGLFGITFPLVPAAAVSFATTTFVLGMWIGALGSGQVQGGWIDHPILVGALVITPMSAALALVLMLALRQRLDMTSWFTVFGAIFAVLAFVYGLVVMSLPQISIGCPPCA